MCIRDSHIPVACTPEPSTAAPVSGEVDESEVTFSHHMQICLLYTSDAADDLLCVDLGGRRIITKKKHTIQSDKNTPTIDSNTPATPLRRLYNYTIVVTNFTAY